MRDGGRLSANDVATRLRLPIGLLGQSRFLISIKDVCADIPLQQPLKGHHPAVRPPGRHAVRMFRVDRASGEVKNMGTRNGIFDAAVVESFNSEEGDPPIVLTHGWPLDMVFPRGTEGCAMGLSSPPIRWRVRRRRRT
jgi:hypothetical protein